MCKIFSEQYDTMFHMVYKPQTQHHELKSWSWINIILMLNNNNIGHKTMTSD